MHNEVLSCNQFLYTLSPGIHCIGVSWNHRIDCISALKQVHSELFVGCRVILVLLQICCICIALCYTRLLTYLPGNFEYLLFITILLHFMILVEVVLLVNVISVSTCTILLFTYITICVNKPVSTYELTRFYNALLLNKDKNQIQIQLISYLIIVLLVNPKK